MNTVKKQKKDDLVWLDMQTGEKFHAGVAFFLEEFGEYRLILDAPRTVLYLRPHKAQGDDVSYLVHAPIDISGKFSHRVEVGKGYSNKDTNNDIYMKLGRYAGQRLVLLASER